VPIYLSPNAYFCRARRGRDRRAARRAGRPAHPRARRERGRRGHRHGHRAHRDGARLERDRRRCVRPPVGRRGASWAPRLPGRATAAQTPAAFAELGLERVPTRGWLPVTVPGAPAAWHDLHARFGRLPFAALFAPAIEYAEQGVPVAPLVAARWASSARAYAN